MKHFKFIISLIIGISVIFLNNADFASAGWTSGKYNSAIDFNGTSTYVDGFGAVGNIQTVSFWIKADDLTKSIMDLNGTQTITVSAGTISANNFTSPTIYVDGKISSTLPDIANWHFVAITTATNISASAVVIGKVVDANYFDGKLDEIRFYNYVRIADEIRLDYQSGYAAHLGPTGKTCSEDPASCMDYGLVGNWPFDEGSGQGAYDMSDSKNNGRLGSSASADTADPKWTKGKNSGALKFDGVNDYVDAGNGASLNPQNITIEAWVNPKQVSLQMPIVAKWASTKFTYIIDIFSGKARGIVSDATNSRFRTSATTLVANLWYHIALTYNIGGEPILYINGISEGTLSGTVITNMSTNNANVLFGKKGDSSTVWHNGSIDEVRIYNRALSAEEIRYHYNRGGPVAEWKFDEGSGTKAFDSTENNNNGALVGATHLPTWTAGKYGSALSFDGTEDYVQVTDTANLRFDASTLDYSLFAWTKRTTTGIEYIISKEDADNDGWRLMFNSGNQVVCSEDATDITSTSTITDINWHYIGCAIDRDGNGQIYIDGRADGSAVSMGTDAMATTSNIRIGARSYTSANFFNGAIDEVRIYNYARTAQQVKTEYNGGAVNFK